MKLSENVQDTLCNKNLSEGKNKHFTGFGIIGPFLGPIKNAWYHIEKALLVVHGVCIKGSGLEKLLGKHNLSISGMENTILNVSVIKQVIYGLQISACAIYR